MRVRHWYWFHIGIMSGTFLCRSSVPLRPDNDLPAPGKSARLNAPDLHSCRDKLVNRLDAID